MLDHANQQCRRPIAAIAAKAGYTLEDPSNKLQMRPATLIKNTVEVPARQRPDRGQPHPPDPRAWIPHRSNAASVMALLLRPRQPARLSTIAFGAVMP
jgi:hypothetical protein